MNEQSKKSQGIIIGIIGVATLVIAIIGATFAYFTATQTVDNEISGNAATISFGLNVRKITTVDDDKGGMIPMTDPMVEAAVASDNKACVDDNGNAVCQIYEITVTNQGTASMFLDGFVNLSGGLLATNNSAQSGKTTMRWVQVFPTSTQSTNTKATAVSENGSTNYYTFSVSGTHKFAPGTNGSKAVSFVQSGLSNTNTTLSTSQVASTTYEYGGNNYQYISNNYLRMSKEDSGSATYNRTNDAQSTLVINQYLAPADNTENGGDDQSKLYIAVWLTETGTDQTPLTSTAGQADSSLNFFSGKVIFNSAKGGEVTATFSGYTKVTPDTMA